MNLETLLAPLIITAPAIGLLVGLAAYLSGSEHVAGLIWVAATVPVLGVLLAQIVISLRRGDVGLDIVAALSMLAALVFGEFLAAAVVALMYAGGQYLEAFAERRAGREMTSLLARVPRSALRYQNGRFEEIGLRAGVALSDDGKARAGMGVDAADLDNSGIPTLVVTNFQNEMLGLYRGSPEGSFDDIVPGSELGRITRRSLGFGCFFFDPNLEACGQLWEVLGDADEQILELLE